MKSQLFGVAVQSMVLALCVSGGLGFEMGENLFSSIVVVLSVFWWICFFTIHDDETWRKQAPGANVFLRFVIRSLLGLQILAAFAFGWFWVGGLHLFTALLIYGRQLQAKSSLSEV
ncbi:hypothetical protein ACSTIX_10440 [Vibrio parahaemolyticus]